MFIQGKITPDMLVLHFVLIENIHYSWIIWDKWYAKEKQDQKQSCQKKQQKT